MFKKLVIISYISLQFFILGCSQSPQKESSSTIVEPTNELKEFITAKYGEKFDWIIEDGKKADYPLSIKNDSGFLEQYRSFGIDLEPFVGETLPTYQYNLEPKCKINGNENNYVLIIVKNQDDTEFLGGFLGLLGTEGGGFPIQSVKETFNAANCSKPK